MRTSGKTRTGGARRSAPGEPWALSTLTDILGIDEPRLRGGRALREHERCRQLDEPRLDHPEIISNLSRFEEESGSWMTSRRRRGSRSVSIRFSTFRLRSGRDADFLYGKRLKAFVKPEVLFAECEPAADRRW
jgi:hypothetical protein